MPLLDRRAWRVAWAPFGRLFWLATVGLLPAEHRDRFDAGPPPETRIPSSRHRVARHHTANARRHGHRFAERHSARGTTRSSARTSHRPAWPPSRPKRPTARGSPECRSPMKASVSASAAPLLLWTTRRHPRARDWLLHRPCVCGGQEYRWRSGIRDNAASPPLPRADGIAGELGYGCCFCVRWPSASPRGARLGQSRVLARAGETCGAATKCEVGAGGGQERPRQRLATRIA